MATNTITFGGDTLPCTVERFPTIKKAARKFRQYSVPGRNGDVFFQSDAWENVIQSYQIYAGGDTDGDAWTGWDAIVPLLNKTGYQVLQDTYDSTHYRLAVFNGPIDIENSWNTHGRATIEFNCRPERFFRTGAAATHYAATASGLTIWRKSDLSPYLRNSVFDTVSTEYVYAFTVDGGDHSIRFMNLLNDGQSHKVAYITVGTETTATGAGSQTGPGNYFNKSGVNPADCLVPASYFGGIPIIKIDGVTQWLVDTLSNAYMPAHPSIVLHKVASHAAETIAAHLGQYGIYIIYDADHPYYFIDTENWNVSKAASLLGTKIPADNVRVDPGIQLDTGSTEIYTSAYYEMDLTSNFWEL